MEATGERGCKGGIDKGDGEARLTQGRLRTMRKMEEKFRVLSPSNASFVLANFGVRMSHDTCINSAFDILMYLMVYVLNNYTDAIKSKVSNINNHTHNLKSSGLLFFSILTCDHFLERCF